jgi:hypothetical protein
LLGGSSTAPEKTDAASSLGGCCVCLFLNYY